MDSETGGLGNPPSKMKALRMTSPLTVRLCFALLLAAGAARAQEAPRASIDGSELGWKPLGQADFAKVNCDDGTWKFGDDGVIHCTGQPVGVIRSVKPYKNLELVVEWRHLKPAGNSGVFVWTPMESLADLKPGGLPHGIEVQVLDLGYKDEYEKSSGKKADWFTCHGDVFSVGSSKMKPFAPIAPDGRRSFPRQERSRGVGQWNHYYIRAVNGEVRLWVNGAEVSGGNDCQPAEGYLCLESEGSPVEFRGLRLRELP